VTFISAPDERERLQQGKRLDLPGAIELLVFAGVVLSSPFYSLTVILPPGHWFAALLCVIVLSKRRMPFTTNQWRMLSPLVAFICLTTLVGAIWALALRSPDPLVAPFAYASGGMLFISILTLSNRHGHTFIDLAFFAIIASLLIQLVWSCSQPIRWHLEQCCMYFDNPNQLGLHAVVCGCLIAAIATAAPAAKLPWVFIGGFLILYYLRLSLSRAAIGAGLALILLLPILLRKRARLVYIAILATSCVTAAIFWDTQALSNVADRIARTGHGRYDNLEGRGYDRIVNHPQYLLFGAGEGGYRRFRTALPREMHSTLGTIVFSYGLAGLALFLAFLFRLSVGQRRRALVVLVPFLVYGLTHHALRSIYAWLLFAILACLQESKPPVDPRPDPESDRSRAPIATGEAPATG
jgi:hypothetical protein